MLKKDELADPTSCINKAADDEPVFVLRAQDYYAPYVIREWIKLAKSAPPEKLTEAELLAQRMLDWPNRKRPD